MEMFIQIEKNADGSHASQHGGSLQEGWAYWDTDKVLLPETFPWVEIEIAEVSHKAVIDGEKVLLPAFTQLEVVSATEGKVIEVETVVSSDPALIVNNS